MVPLDKETMDRIEGIVNPEIIAYLKSCVDVIADDMIADGFDAEDVYAYTNGIILETLIDKLKFK